MFYIMKYLLLNLLFIIYINYNKVKNTNMPTLNLKNITIKKLTDKNWNPYYLIVNNDNQDEVFFCFEKTVKEGWTDLVNNYENIKEIEIEFIENENNFKVYRKVINLYTSQSEKEIFV